MFCTEGYFIKKGYPGGQEKMTDKGGQVLLAGGMENIE